MKCGRPKWMIRQLFQAFFLTILSVLLAGALVAYLFYFSGGKDYQQFRASSSSSASSSFTSYSNRHQVSSGVAASSHGDVPDFELIPLETAPIRHVSTSALSRPPAKGDHSWRGFGGESRTNCSMFTCFDIHRCGGVHNGSLSIYVYPIQQWFVDGRRMQSQLSIEFYQFLQTLRQSAHFVQDPSKACLFVPSIDLLNLNRLDVSSKELLAVLSSLDFWGKSGKNHLLLTLFPGNSPLIDLKTNAIVASPGLLTRNYRLGFHVPVITPSTLVTPSNSSYIPSKTPFLAAAVSQGPLPSDVVNALPSSVILLTFCHQQRPVNYSERCSNVGGSQRRHEYPDVLQRFHFCLILGSLASPVLWEVMSQNCIPVIIVDHQRLAFDEVLDWTQFSIPLYDYQLPKLSSVLMGVSPQRRARLKAQGRFIFDTYLRSVSKITQTLVAVLQDRVFSHGARSLQLWNNDKIEVLNRSPFFNPVTAPREGGFTAVILAYERVASLFSVVQRVAQSPSVAKILVVWNNQGKEPPASALWPKVPVPVQIIKTSANKMSNRFFPYDEIETEAVFSVDDDIVMLTVDEVEFAFQTWREFPDRIVGFPSRSHVWDNGTRRWKYESEWTSEISMVLTGAAFYHKYWHYAYTNELSRDIRDWVDARMNCEDIAMNFLVAARTNKSPIKVSPRKKFKCPTCNNNEMLSADTGHMLVRTDCVNRFSQVMGRMPLGSTEFRADPLLFKVDGVPTRLKRYPDMGIL